MFNSNGITPDGIGWSSPESWGTWTVGDTANLNLSVDLATNLNHSLTIKSTAFLAPLHEKQEVKILLNGSVIGTLKYSLSKNESIRTFEIPSEVLVTGPQSLKFEFIISNPVSPASLRLSEDPRMLGMGLMSMSIN